MNLILFILFRISVFLGSALFAFYLLNPIAVSLGLRVTDWEVFIFYIPIGLIPLWLFDKFVPAKCTKCQKNSFFVDPLSYASYTFTCKSCGVVVTSPLGK